MTTDKLIGLKKKYVGFVFPSGNYIHDVRRSRIDPNIYFFDVCMRLGGRKTKEFEQLEQELKTYFNVEFNLCRYMEEDENAIYVY